MQHLNNILKHYINKMLHILIKLKISFHIKIILINIGQVILQVEHHLKDMLKELVDTSK